MTVLLVAGGGALGATLRYLMDRWIQRRSFSGFPFGTLTVNIAGSVILGFLFGLSRFGAEPSAVQALVGVGLCGALTTFSTFGYETVALFQGRARLYAVLNLVGTVFSCLGAAVVGALIAALMA